MSRADRLLRLVERRLLPWFDRAEADRATVHAEQLRQDSIAARKDAQATAARVLTIRRDYALAAKRLQR
jgi:hypothetical protein